MPGDKLERLTFGLPGGGFTIHFLVAHVGACDGTATLALESNADMFTIQPTCPRCTAAVLDVREGGPWSA